MNTSNAAWLKAIISSAENSLNLLINDLIKEKDSHIKKLETKIAELEAINDNR